MITKKEAEEIDIVKYFNNQKYRGPDFKKNISIDSYSEKIVLGFNRLSITDLTNESNKIFFDNNFTFIR